MRILNLKNPDDVAKIYPWLIPTETETRLEIASELYGKLKESPEDILILVAIERNITRAILIAHVSEKRKKCIWLWQSNAETGFKYSRLMFNALIEWTKAKKAKEIRMKTNRDSKAFQRRWNFEPIKNNQMKFKVS